MARNQPFDFSDDDDLTGTPGDLNISDAELSESGSSSMHGMREDIVGQTGAQSGKQASSAAQQTATQTRSTTGDQDTPTSMRDKRGNQPR